MGEVIWQVDFRKKRDEEIRKQAENLLRMIECAHDQAIYESSLGFIAPEHDPA